MDFLPAWSAIGKPYCGPAGRGHLKLVFAGIPPEARLDWPGGCRSRTVEPEACQQTAELAQKAPGLATWCFAGAGAYGRHIPRAGRCFAPGVLHRLSPCELEINREAVHVMNNYHEGDLTLTGKS